MDVDTKQQTAGQVSMKVTADGTKGTWEAVISTDAEDRDGEILDSGCFTAKHPLPAELPIHADHLFFDVTKVVGRGVPYYDTDGALKIKDGRWASTPDAKLVRLLVEEGMVQTLSVGYIDADYEQGDDGKPHLKSAELIEASFVSVPSNREAIVTMAKRFGFDAKATKAERTQSIHDLSVQNGAACGSDADGTKAIADLVTGKALAGSDEERSENLRSALREDVAPEARWLWIRGTFDDHVVFEVETENLEGGYDLATYDVTYESTDDGFTFGERVEVDLAEIVTPAKAVTPTTPENTPATEPAGKAASDAAVPLAVAQARASLARASALTLT